MNLYLCACDACTWKGNRPHRDGQCPVCGNALRIGIRERRYSPDLATKVVLSGLSGDPKFKAPLPDFGALKQVTDLRSEMTKWLKAGSSLSENLVASWPKLPQADSSADPTAPTPENKG